MWPVKRRPFYGAAGVPVRILGVRRPFIVDFHESKLTGASNEALNGVVT